MEPINKNQANKNEESDFLLSIPDETHRPTQPPVAKWEVQPEYLADPRMRPGQVYMADRFGYMKDDGTTEPFQK